MVHYYLSSLNLIFCWSLIQGSMELQLPQDKIHKSHATAFYATTYDEGYGVTSRFFSGRKNSLCLDDTMEPRELLSVVLRNPETEQKEGGLSFKDFQNFYQGVEAALKNLKYDAVPQTKAPFIQGLLQSCQEIAQAQSYEDLFTITRNSQWHVYMATLDALLSKCTVTQKQTPEDKCINPKDVLAVIEQPDTSVLYDVIPSLDSAIRTGNITSADIDPLLAVVIKLLDIPLKSFKVIDAEEHEDYQKTLMGITKRVIVLKKSPDLLYFRTHEDSFFPNDHMVAVNNFTECLLATQGLTEGRNITLEALESCRYCNSFFEGISVGLTHHPTTLGRMYALKKLVAFIECLPPELELLEKNKQHPSKHNDDLAKSIVYSPDLIEHLQRLVGELHQLDRNLLGVAQGKKK